MNNNKPKETNKAEVQSRCRVIESWAIIYDVVNYFVNMMFGGENKFRKDIVSMARLEEVRSVLDVGCGTGSLTLEIAKLLPSGGRVIGMDAGWKMVALARNKRQNSEKQIKFLQVSAENIAFTDEAFDCVFNVFLLHHLPMELKLVAINEMYRVLKKEGVLVMVDVDRPSNLLGWLIGLTRFYVKEIRDNMKTPLCLLLSNAGFKNVSVVKKKWGIFSYLLAYKTI